ncbi:Partitioning or sporulation protein ParA OS=uncultured planctomycete GN=HGMM_F01A04C17 PE=4 SV=1: CbiA [Tuwongella immobilis]|uniref:AAA domain-containing protein n=1 Tax=Tuwongella immobilis TaxID=692036 RepID=A0A6C2YT73_9BACT|nr:ParA family protein [Tuwongella immobilis]VIP04604.1 Partitioning or sporulation protein ParA OS=uncultured planctomycete GN=HGMM_F01A04C17 PE=4 SV=1: CbiA [Tuwongella immobilis]VTS06569.1 Partitioning or sporulation protein ParA OS=uncultured planctomycete GN=HGMM_F01A04C17 PE=4 SV=1: CbiA [Tuwongella immobilis]
MQRTARRIAIINQKGGVGKTTTSVNLAAALANKGRKVCVLDLDPQAHATTHLGIEPDVDLPSMYDILVKNRAILDVRRDVNENLSIVGSDIDLAAAEVELAGIVGREVILREALSQDPEELDFVLMDCAPSLGVLTLNALAAADEVFIPLQPHFLALHGLSKLLETTELVCKRINPRLRVTGVIVCMYESATKLAQEVVRDLNTFFERCRGSNKPWANAQVFTTKIRRNIKLAECPSFGQSIFQYAPSSNGAADYLRLAKEVLGEPLTEPTPVPVVTTAIPAEPMPVPVDASLPDVEVPVAMGPMDLPAFEAIPAVDVGPDAIEELAVVLPEPVLVATGEPTRPVDAELEALLAREFPGAD